MKKGFTLIELLAVIVILAIIALIATPIVLNIINDAKESTTLRSADFYISALENEIMLENMKKGGSFNPNECQITNRIVSCDGKEINLKVDGEVPNNGSITFENGKVISVDLKYTSDNVILNNKGELVLNNKTEDKEEPKDPEDFNETDKSEEKAVCALVENGDIEPTGISAGDKYQCKVKDDMETGFEDGYYFYVLGTNDDGTTNLIMERNIYYDETNDVGLVSTETNTGLLQWSYSGQTNSYGPIRPMEYLHNATKDWDKIPNIVIDYIDKGSTGSYGYGSIKTTDNITIMTNKNNEETGMIENLKARLPKFDELHGTGKCMTFEENGAGSCPLWLVNNLTNSSYYKVEEGKTNISGISSYWTLSSKNDSSFTAWYVHFDGSLSASNVVSTKGIRAVITVKL